MVLVHCYEITYTAMMYSEYPVEKLDIKPFGISWEVDVDRIYLFKGCFRIFSIGITMIIMFAFFAHIYIYIYIYILCI